ncbi:MAG: two-component system response regulator, partial [Candidatus Latescibacterota bacterium]
MPEYSAPRKNPLVLVVDDDEMSRYLVRKTLESSNFTVEEAVDGADALKAFRNLNPDIVLLDVLMPVLDGYSACAEIRALPGGDIVPVIMMTGLDDVDSVKKAFDSGATDFITKPINYLILKYRIQYIFRASRTVQRLWLSESRLVEAQRIAKIGSWEMNITTGEMIWSDEVYRVFGIEPVGCAISHESFINATYAPEREIVADQIRKAFAEENGFCLECQITRADGVLRSIHFEARIERGDGEQPSWAVGYVQDITERRMAEDQIRYLAYFDNLTGLPNRRLFNDYLNRALSLAHRTKRLLAVLFLDLDRFKQINDTLG